MDNRIIYDWVSFTSKIHDVKAIIDMLGLVNVKFESLGGLNGYRDRYFFDGISICYNGREDMGVFVNMSGKGCRAFETYGNGDYDKLFNIILSFYDPKSDKRLMNLTRLDVAYDDFNRLIDLSAIAADVQKGSFVSRFNSWGLTIGSDGCCVNHGSKSSETYIRIYDKKSEQNADDLDYWVRCEIQLRRANAIGFISNPDSIGVKYFGVLNNYLRYVIPEDDTNKRRWQTADHWLKWIERIKPISVASKPGVDYTLDNIDHYVFTQASGAVSTLIDIIGVDNFMVNLYKSTLNKPLNSKYKFVKCNNVFDSSGDNLKQYLIDHNLLGGNESISDYAELMRNVTDSLYYANRSKAGV